MFIHTFCLYMGGLERVQSTSVLSYSVGNERERETSDVEVSFTLML